LKDGIIIIEIRFDSVIMVLELDKCKSLSFAVGLVQGDMDLFGVSGCLYSVDHFIKAACMPLSD